MPKIAKAFLRTRKHYELWQELQDAIDEADEQVPCTSYPDLFLVTIGTLPSLTYAWQRTCAGGALLCCSVQSTA